MEVWKPIPGYKSLYEVSTHGRVRSKDRKIRQLGKGKNPKPYTRVFPGRILKPNICGTKRNPDILRQCVTLYKNGVPRNLQVSYLVLRTFVGKRPSGYQCCHKNGNSADDRLSNLRYDTPVGNMRDTYRHGTIHCGERSGPSKLTYPQVKEIRRRFREEDITYVALGRGYGVKGPTISNIVRYQTWRIFDDGTPIPPEQWHKFSKPARRVNRGK